MPTLAIYAASGLIAGFIAIGILAGWARLRKKA
jgi:Flp pilus assembly pilin Flp